MVSLLKHVLPNNQVYQTVSDTLWLMDAIKKRGISTRRNRCKANLHDNPNDNFFVIRRHNLWGHTDSYSISKTRDQIQHCGFGIE